MSHEGYGAAAPFAVPHETAAAGAGWGAAAAANGGGADDVHFFDEMREVEL